RTMHHGGVEFNFAIFVRQSAQTDRIVLGVILLPFQDHDGSIERVAAATHQLVSAIDALDAGVLANDHRLAGGGCVRGLGRLRESAGRSSNRGGSYGGGFDEFTARKLHARGSWKKGPARHTSKK